MSLDARIAIALNSLAGRAVFFDGLVIFFASYFPWLVALAFALSVSTAVPHTLFLALVSALAARFGAAEVIRAFYERPRPYLVHREIRALFTDSGGSFPSGHALFFAAVVTIAAFSYPAWSVILGASIAVTLISRVIAGVHYPSDIAGGYSDRRVHSLRSHTHFLGKCRGILGA